MKKTIKLSLAPLLLANTIFAQEVTLDTIIVTSGTKNEQNIHSLTSNIDVVTSEEIKYGHFEDVVQSLNSVAGINFTNYGGLGSTSSINLRGAGNNRTLILIDGVRYQDPSNINGSSMSHLMMDNVKQIEILKGAQSGIWGADASGGVINIITQPAKTGTSVRTNIEGGTFNTKKVAAGLSHKSSKFDLKADVQKIKSNGFSTQSPYGYDMDQFEDDAYKNINLSLKGGYNFSNTSRIEASYVKIDATKEYDSYNNPNDRTLMSDISTRLYNAQYSQKIANNKITFKVQRSDFHRDEIGTTGNSSVKELEGTYANIELHDFIKYNSDDYFLLGLGQSKDQANFKRVSLYQRGKKNKDRYGYVTNSNTLQGLTLTESLRHDKYDSFNSKTTGKIGIKYNFFADAFATANYGTAYNVPNIIQELNPWGGSNTLLNPENTKSYDLSLSYKSFMLSGFYNLTKDLIEWYDPDGWGGNPAIYKNHTGKSRFKGVEAKYSDYILENIKTSLSYNYLSARDKDGKRLSNRPKHTYKLSFDYFVKEYFHAGIDVEHIGRRYQYLDEKGKQTGKYTLLNLTANYKINKHFDTYIKIDNLTNKYYQIIDGYSTPDRSLYLGFNAKY